MASHGDDFPIWKIKIRGFVKSLGRDVSFAIEKEFKEFDHRIDPWPKNVAKVFEENARATYTLMKVLSDDDLSRVINCEPTFEIWNTLITTYEETSQVKRAKIDFLTSQYENFKMHDNEAIDDMLTCFSKITNGLISLGESIFNDDKIIQSLFKPWEVKVTTLKELNDSKKIDFTAFRGNLKTHEWSSKLGSNKNYKRR